MMIPKTAVVGLNLNETTIGIFISNEGGEIGSTLAISYDQELLANTFLKIGHYFNEDIYLQILSDIKNLPIPERSDLLGIEINGLGADMLIKLMLPMLIALNDENHQQEVLGHLEKGIPQGLFIATMLDDTLLLMQSDEWNESRVFFIYSQKELISQTEIEIFRHSPELRELALLKCAKQLPVESDKDQFALTGLVAHLIIAVYLFLLSSGKLQDDNMVMKDTRPPWADNAQNN